MMKQLDLYEKLRIANLKWEDTQHEKDFDTLEKIEDEFEKAHEYTTAAELGEAEQAKMLKALDYGDVICEGWRRFFVCKAGGAGNHCGFAFPSKLWLQKGRKSSPDPAERLKPGNWQYKCCCMWEYLQEESVDHPGSAADLWFKDMIDTYGEVSRFPHVGCGANYVPWARGPSMVCEIQLRQSSGEWEAFFGRPHPSGFGRPVEEVEL